MRGRRYAATHGGERGNGMFDNPGKKIKVLAWIQFVIGCIIAVGGGLWAGGFVTPFAKAIAEKSNISETILVIITVFLVIMAGVLVSWVLALMLYSWGQAVDNSDMIARKVTRIVNYIDETDEEEEPDDESERDE